MRHHQSICSKTVTRCEVDGSGNKSSEEMKNEICTAGSANCTITAGSQITTKKQVLLQTARAIATNEGGLKTATVRILFDSGSQRSYITDDLRRKLRLNAIKSETLHLNTFGDNKHKKSCQVFYLTLLGRNGSESKTSVLNFPIICSPLPALVDIFDYPHIRELELADYDEGQGPPPHDSIDVLVGSDYYWNFVTGETVCGDFGPIAVKSVFLVGCFPEGPNWLSPKRKDVKGCQRI
ncbi:Hypothetical predicted protein [Paramuricea clavata]|uniref:DUF1758 domain-containing protein n=1 Tax=Paramuricea clavata TaxID=317549 RepID=A0A7D9EL35_PARCT|nr:Hypothetical predicted protein [Paramuricea clavata]